MDIVYKVKFDSDGYLKELQQCVNTAVGNCVIKKVDIRDGYVWAYPDKGEPVTVSLNIIDIGKYISLGEVENLDDHWDPR